MQGIAAIAQAVNGIGAGSGFSANALGWTGNDAVGSLHDGMGSIGAGETPATAPATPFAGLVTGAVESMNALNQQAASMTAGLIEGTGVDIHQAMIATAKAEQSFELALAVRNKAVAAYQQVMNLQF
jgi:flagellar hook-basal body complex protein FliE